MHIATPTKDHKDAPLRLRNHPGYREAIESLRVTTKAAEDAAINAIEHVDIMRGRAQALRAVLSYLEPKD